MDYKVLFKQFVKDLLESNVYSQELVDKYISHDYRQYVNKEFLDYDGFISHLKILKKNIKTCRIEFVDIICEGNQVHSTHIVHATTMDNKKLKAKVIGLFTFIGDRLVKTDELTCLLEGDEKNADMGSRH